MKRVSIERDDLLALLIVVLLLCVPLSGCAGIYLWAAAWSLDNSGD
jgi:hypothetical protein